jgi:DNA-binding transcriptional regulator PaaX
MKKALGRDMRMNRGKINRDRLGSVERELLIEITNADIGNTIFRAHSIGQMMYMAEQNARKRAHKRHALQMKIARLKQKGLLEIIEDTDGAIVRITPAGMRELNFVLKKWAVPKTWDKKWRVLFFDIPETNSQLRQELRGLLKQIGYLGMQNSVYVYPYSVPELEDLLEEKSLPATQVAYSVCESISQEHLLKKHFKLA